MWVASISPQGGTPAPRGNSVIVGSATVWLWCLLDMYATSRLLATWCVGRDCQLPNMLQLPLAEQQKSHSIA